MSKKNASKLILPCLTLLAAAMAQAEEGAGVSGEITAKLNYFNYSDGPGAGLTQYLQAYGGQESWSGDIDDGLYGDLDIRLAVGDSLTLERQGYGLGNHRGQARVNTSGIAFNGYYSHFRSNSGGVEYLNNPNLMPVDNQGVGGTDCTYEDDACGLANNTNSGYIAQFNNDSPGQTAYKTERTTYGLGMKLKPGLLGGWGSISVAFDGYRRDGNELATWVAGGSDLTGAPLSRWRGYDRPIDENMHRFSLNLTAAPKGLFTLTYDGSLEKFDNQAGYFTMDTLLPALNNAGTGKALHFVPDSTLMSHAVRIAKTFDSTVVAAGYGMTRLEQDSFTTWQTDRAYTNGKIATDNAYLTVNHRLTPTVEVEALVKYFNRDNDSTYPAVGLIDADGSTETLGVRINDIESLNYGLAATFRGLPAKSSLTAGWKHDDIDRDLTFNNTANGIKDAVSLYDAKTESDEVYMKWIARPMKGMTVRLTPSYVWADKTGLVTEPERAFNLKAQMGYAMDGGKHVSAYYNYKRKENGNNTLTDKHASLDVHEQDVDNTFHSAGVSLNLAATEKLSASVGLDWTQNDFDSYYFSSDVRRYEANTDFLRRGHANFKADTWSLSFNADYQASDRLRLSAGYTWSLSDGDSTTVDDSQSYTVREEIDNTLHSLVLGAGYALKKGMTLRAGYVFDKYEDDAYDALSGHVHTLMLGMSFTL
ncbi:MAG: MtrB/PioB family outer membrane beta-barrel protein [Gallionellaceae bacterium]|nr:MtrB/PioB family outer membrane beta-barrel protein [Gallionellaceae bacterium]